MKAFPDAFKSEFPLFAQPENSDLVYLDNAATCQRPAAVIDAINHCYLHSNANAHRGSHRLARAATELLESVRERLADFIGADTDEVVFCRGATEGLNFLAHSIGAGLTEGDVVILSELEHHANIVPWQMLAREKALTLRYLPIKNGVVDLDSLPSMLDANVKVISLSLASNVTGKCLEVEAFARACHGHSCVRIFDASQYMAHQALDVKRMPCDFLMASAHKFYGPTGVGFVYGRREKLHALPPWQGGGEMIDSVTLSATKYAEGVRRFEAGTASLASIAGLGGCIDFLQRQDRPAMRRYEKELCDYAFEKLGAISGLRLLSDAANNIGVISFDLIEQSVHDLGIWLDQRDIALRAGKHCAEPLAQVLGVEESLRLSLAAYNSHTDIDRLCIAIQEFLQIDQQGYDFSAISLEQLREQRQWQNRYRLLMQWSKKIESRPDIQQDEYRVDGCESPAWLFHEQRGDEHFFFLDSRSRIVKGLGVLLLLLLNGKTREQMIATDCEAEFAELGLDRHLSPSRTNGVRAMLKKMHEYVGL